jgi:hypothetical protein
MIFRRISVGDTLFLWRATRALLAVDPSATTTGFAPRFAVRAAEPDPSRPTR